MGSRHTLTKKQSCKSGPPGRVGRLRAGLSTGGRLYAASLQLPSQCLHQLPDHLLIPPIPTPLTALRRFHESRLRENSHVMRNGRLRQMNSLFNVPAAQTAFKAGHIPYDSLRGRSFFQSPQNAAPRGVGNGMKRAVEHGIGNRHDRLEITRESMPVNVGIKSELIDDHAESRRSRVQNVISSESGYTHPRSAARAWPPLPSRPYRVPIALEIAHRLQTRVRQMPDSLSS